VKNETRRTYQTKRAHGPSSQDILAAPNQPRPPTAPALLTAIGKTLRLAGKAIAEATSAKDKPVDAPRTIMPPAI